MKLNRYLLVTFIFFLMVFCLVSCKQQSNKAGGRELIPNPEKYEHDGYAQLPDSLKPAFMPDTIIGKICLLDTLNVKEYLGVDIMNKLNDEDIPNVSVVSQDGRQRLKLYFHPGGNKNEFAEFEVLYSVGGDRKMIRVADDEFISESGIKLGITVGDLRSIQGEPMEIDDAEHIVFYYKTDSSDNADFLRRFNFPEYYAEYEFRNGYLERFKFGFEYQ